MYRVNVLSHGYLTCWLTVFFLMPIARAEENTKTVLKTESFDRDPNWQGHDNRIVPKEYPTIVQDFGYSRTNFAGKSTGEMGGQITRASTPAYYAAKIAPK